MPQGEDPIPPDVQGQVDEQGAGAANPISSGVWNNIGNLMARSIDDPFLLLPGLIALVAFFSLVAISIYVDLSGNNIVLLFAIILIFVLSSMYMAMKLRDAPILQAGVDRDLQNNVVEANRLDNKQRQLRRRADDR